MEAKLDSLFGYPRDERAGTWLFDFEVQIQK
jgi:hypothetical protein